MSFGRLYLFPTTISEAEIEKVIPQLNIDLIKNIKQFIAEDAKTARKFLKLCAYPNIQDATIEILNQHTESGSVSQLINHLLKGEDMGLMSDAGCPGVADPGAEIVKLAQQKNITVIPLVGPSSILLTMMGSGFNGQNFAFVGYLPIDKSARIKRIKELEALAQRFKQAQYFIETPYRNGHLFQDLISALSPSTWLCVGVNLTDTNQKMLSKTVADWKREKDFGFDKTPVVFGIYS